MSPTKIEKLTPEQEALIPLYREKWRAIALSTERIDRQEAEEIIKAAYVMLGEKQPKILFFDSPNAAMNFILNQNQAEDSKENEPQTYSRGKLLDWKLHKLDDALVSQVYAQIDTHRLYINGQLDEQLRSYWEIARWEGLDSQVNNQIWRQLDDQSREKLQRQVGSKLYTYFRPGLFIANDVCELDFFISVLNTIFSKEEWAALQSLLKFSNWVYPFENTRIVCDRPIQLLFDNENRLHAEGEPAIQFADGYSLYSYHGVTLPEKYGKLHPNQWQVKWLLKEDNAELRRVLIQGVGYNRICQELQAIELDSWQEYILLKIISDVDIEPINLLKMTCPSTGHIHALRVPPDINSVREAINWVNWGIAPEEFSVQT